MARWRRSAFTVPNAQEAQIATEEREGRARHWGGIFCVIGRSGASDCVLTHSLTRSHAHSLTVTLTHSHVWT